jgi:Fic family protein
MSETETNIRALDSAYQPFPNFERWSQELAIDTVRWDRYYSSLKARAGNTPVEMLSRARNIAKRAAALDTGALEGLYEVDQGFTYTVALEKKGDQVRPLFEAQLHAYDYVLDLATKAEPISEASIRALHVEVCRAQDTYRVMTAVGPQEQPLPKGLYKALPNHVRTRKGGDHSYARVNVTPDEMHRLATELRSDLFLSAHPVLQAAYAHYCLVVIHPFADGNGRVARALASAFTYRAISVPVVILSEQKNGYLDDLEMSDAGDYQPFADFMLNRCLDTITLVDESLRSAATDSGESIAAAFQSFYVTRGGYTHEQVDQLGKNLAEMFLNAVSDNIKKITAVRLKVEQNQLVRISD